MWNWFRAKPQCPIDHPTRQWIDGRWQWLEQQFGLPRLRSVAVVLPQPQFFPERYRGTEEDARKMLDRVCRYMEIDPDTVELAFYEDNTPAYEGHWREGTAGLYQAGGGKFRIWIEVSNLDDPLAMVATMAHELGHVHLLGHGRISGDATDHEPLTDLLTVFLGLGVFTANSVVREQYWHSGNYYGWKMGRRGYLGMPQYGYSFARFARARGEDGGKWLSELRLDVRTAFKQSMGFLQAEACSQTEAGRAEPDVGADSR